MILGHQHGSLSGDSRRGAVGARGEVGLEGVAGGEHPVAADGHGRNCAVDVDAVVALGEIDVGGAGAAVQVAITHGEV